GPLAPGATLQKTFGLSQDSKEKILNADKLAAIIDYTNAINEKNENNNVMEKNVIVEINIKLQ
ncbi:MAG: CARDB domain-containing protein, partial [Armatimonadota bacterium]